MQGRARGHRGFTVIELLAGVAIVAIVLVWGVPSVAEALDAARVRATASGLHAALALARTQAITTQTRIVLCASADAAACGTARDWNRGWIAFADRDRDDRRDPDEALILVERRGARPDVSVASSTGRPRVRYRPDGFAGGTNLTFSVCGPGARVAGRIVVVSNVGRARVAALPAGAAACKGRY